MANLSITNNTCTALTQGGFTWRLPTEVEELARNTNFFFWASTTDTFILYMAVYADRSYSIWKKTLALT
ncbi:MAG: hypothetical protein ACI8PW_001183 [Methylophilaceae bacterium]|jgi:hypothetical protein